MEFACTVRLAVFWPIIWRWRMWHGRRLEIAAMRRGPLTPPDDDGSSPPPPQPVMPPPGPPVTDSAYSVNLDRE